jgi:hypothetical protein
MFGSQKLTILVAWSLSLPALSLGYVLLHQGSQDPDVLRRFESHCASELREQRAELSRILEEGKNQQRLWLTQEVSTARRLSEENQWLAQLAASLHSLSTNAQILDAGELPVTDDLSFDELVRAFDENPLPTHLDYGEQEHLRLYARFLQSYARLRLADSQKARAFLAARGFSFEDLRYLNSFFHYYLAQVWTHFAGVYEKNPLVAKPDLDYRPWDSFDGTQLRVFAEKDYERLVGELD